MAIRKAIEERHGIFFITFSCYRWIPLFEITNSYDLVYNWFEILIKKGHQIAGYVIMTNHIHMILALHNSRQSLNTLVANGKRFIAYEIIKRLDSLNEQRVLSELGKGITQRERVNGQVHRVFERSFDAKLCESEWFIEQKLEYIHKNPCNGKWKLAEHPVDYKHSSARFYMEYEEGINSRLTPYTALFE